MEKIERGEKNKPSLKKMIPFNIFKYVSALDKDLMRADYEYYKDRGDFYYETKMKTSIIYNSHSGTTSAYAEQIGNFLSGKGSMFRKMENLLRDKSDPPTAILKSRSKELTDKNISTAGVLINS